VWTFLRIFAAFFEFVGMNKIGFLGLGLLLCLCVVARAQSEADSADLYFQHLQLDEVTVTGLTGESRLKETPASVTVVTEGALQGVASTNIIDAISKQPGVSQVTTGGAISKPVIRGLGYNRVAVIHDGIRQEGQQWGDEHGVEVDAQSVGQVEIVRGPASLMYGSDAMAGVLIIHPRKVLPPGKMGASLTTGYQTNNGLFDYSADFAGNRNGVVWDGRWSQKLAHAYQNRRDGYVPGSQFQERAANGMVGLNKEWGHSHLTLSYYHLIPGMVEGERDEETGELVSLSDNRKTYGKTLPFQHVEHGKVVWDNSFWMGNGNLKVLLGYQLNRRREFEESA
jgi:iron complex outermembrane receptor protein